MNKDQQKIARHVKDLDICHGVGDKESHCTMAAINYALTGIVTDDIPDCTSEVIGTWVVELQDQTPITLINSDKWKNLVPLIYGSGRDHEQQRIDILIQWMWESVLPQLLPLTKKVALGSDWQYMLSEQTSVAASFTERATDDWVFSKVAGQASRAARFTDLGCTLPATEWVTHTINSIISILFDEGEIVDEVSDYWEALDPVGLLEKLIKVSGEQL